MLAVAGDRLAGDFLEPSLRVILVRRRGLGQPSDEQEVSWPTGWRLPVAGETVHLSREFGGFVEYVGWDLGSGAFRIFLR